MKRQLFIPLALLAVGLVLLARPARAQDYSKIRIVRLSFVEGTVQYRQPGGDWQDAGMNLPIQEGFALRTTDGYAEVEFEDALAVRLGTNSTMEFPVLAMLGGGRITQLAVPQGTAIISAKLKRQDTLSVGAPNLTAKVAHDGRFRIDASPAENWVTVFHGKVEVESGSGTSSLLGGGHTLHEDANGSSEIANNPPQDEFDKWVAHREDAVNVARNETSDMISINGYTAGFADLYANGLWSYLPGYGLGWMPYGVGPGWMPFVNGQWQFMGPTGWNWVSPEPWGWLPYHFGSWVNSPGIGWAWVPVGGASWVPATANWVQVNNQLGWIPKGPPLRSKPTTTQQAALPATVIVAGHGDAATITAGSRIPLAKSGIGMSAVSAPLPPLSALPGQSVPVRARANGGVRPNAFVQNAPASPTVARSAPSSLRAPGSSFAQTRSARPGSAPRALLAPQSTAASAVMRAVSSGGSGRGFSGGRAGGGGGMAAGSGAGVAASPTSASPRVSAGSVSHAGGSARSSGSRR
jgi:hypothetical protein